MALRSAPTARAPAARAPQDAQENQDPDHVGFAAKSLVSAAGPPSKARNSISGDSGPHKHRRALHSIDSNRPRPAVDAPKRSLSSAPACGLQSPSQAKKPHGQAASSVPVSREANSAQERLETGHTGDALAAANETQSSCVALEQLEQQESENLAWMDMMLALLEKRYGAEASLPVCLSDLEAAKLLQLPQRKRLKTGVASQSRTSLDASRTQTTCTTNNRDRSAAAPCSGTNLQQTPARFELEQEQGLSQEDKRQRLLLRHAQQIQASSVSSSTSCGCKTGCLKMYCMCFSSRGFCHAGCACDDCKNGRKNQAERVEAIQNYLANDPRAFSFASLPQSASTTGFLHLLPQKSSAVVMRGCRCKKSKCLKKYCECFQNGIACTSHCRCMDCSNHSESTAAHQHPHLQKGSTTTHGKPAHSGSSVSPTAKSKPFHPVQITVTKQPRRNLVGKTLRLNL
ncbi:Exosome complex exonuclease RRP41 protein [Phytophthora cinnamomi]|uniref:Exosome complex exonuclease RRP41 protein n=1 Tax=Phytophthora cinnamomi TaxID=4785 RepID=UPI0035597342|nr:Exosome complex exonuclease RRP41 protein [Phytophthora cinnamomi]